MYKCEDHTPRFFAICFSLPLPFVFPQLRPLLLVVTNIATYHSYSRLRGPFMFYHCIVSLRLRATLAQSRAARASHVVKASLLAMPTLHEFIPLGCEEIRQIGRHTCSPNFPLPGNSPDKVAIKRSAADVSPIREPRNMLREYQAEVSRGRPLRQALGPEHASR